MELLKSNPFDLVANPWNSNRVNRENFEKLKKSLRELGSFKPVVVRELADGRLQILGGYHRVEAAKELGFPSVPIFNVGKIDDERAKEISLVDNARYGQDDTELLSKLLDEIDTELLGEILPDAPVEIPDLGDLTDKLTDDLAAATKEDDTHKFLKFRLENEKADEVEMVLGKIASDNGYQYGDGYWNLADALYHALVLDRK